MRSYRLRLLLSLLASTAIVWVAYSAASPTFSPGMTSWELLLNDSDVQKELKLTPEQIKKIATECRSIRTQVLAKYRNYQAPNSVEASAKERDAMQQIYAATEKPLAGLLNEEQLKRLRQIDRQQRSLWDAENQKELELTAAQVERLRKVRTTFDNATRQLIRKYPADRTARVAAWQELRKPAVADAMDVLTAEQRKKWQEQTGEPFYSLKFDQSNGIAPKMPVANPPPQMPIFSPTRLINT